MTASAVRPDGREAACVAGMAENAYVKGQATAGPRSVNIILSRKKSVRVQISLLLCRNVQKPAHRASLRPLRSAAASLAVVHRLVYFI